MSLRQRQEVQKVLRPVEDTWRGSAGMSWLAVALAWHNERMEANSPEAFLPPLSSLLLEVTPHVEAIQPYRKRLSRPQRRSRRRLLRHPDRPRGRELPHQRTPRPRHAHPRHRHGEGGRRRSQPRPRTARRQDRRRHHPGRAGNSARQMARAFRGRCLPGRRRRQLPHEHQRGDRQPRF